MDTPNFFGATMPKRAMPSRLALVPRRSSQARISLTCALTFGARSARPEFAARLSLTVTPLVFDIRIALRLYPHANWHARKAERIAQTVHEIARVVARQFTGLIGEDREGRRPR